MNVSRAEPREIKQQQYNNNLAWRSDEPTAKQDLKKTFVERDQKQSRGKERQKEGGEKKR